MNPYGLYMAKVAEEQNDLSARSNAMEDVAKNVGYGMLAGGRGGPISPVGASMGGVIDGFLLRPALNAGADLISKGLSSGSESKATI